MIVTKSDFGRNFYWIPYKKPLAILSLLLCLSSAISITLLYNNLNYELNYILTSLYAQKQCSETIITILNLKASEKAFLNDKTETNYNNFLQLSEHYNILEKDLKRIYISYRPLYNNIEEFIKLSNQEVASFSNKIEQAKNSTTITEQTTNIEENYNEKAFNKIITILATKINSDINTHEKILRHLKHLSTLDIYIFITSLVLFSYTIMKSFAYDLRALEATENKLNQENIALKLKFKKRTRDLEQARLYAEKERKRAELLLQDTSHRIGNSLATVASLLSIQATRSSEVNVSDALISARDRIQNIATAHRRLRLGSDMETTKIDDLLKAIIHDLETAMPSEARERIKIKYILHPLYCSSRDATTLGIVMGELLTNCIKHAFPAPSKGEIRVFCGITNEGSTKLIIEDNGIGIDKETAYNLKHKKEGLGMLVAKNLCMQFNSEPIYSTTKQGGTRVTINLDGIKFENIKS